MEDTNLIRISLNELRFFGQFGLYAVEQKWTTELVVDIHLAFPAGHTKHFTLSDTIDYQRVYEIAAVVFSKNEELIENLASRLISELKQQFTQIVELEVEIYKLPVLKGPNGSVSVSLFWSKESE